MPLTKCTDTHGQLVSCVSCQVRIKLAKAYADPQGEPFVSYYCEKCAAEYKRLRKHDNGARVSIHIEDMNRGTDDWNAELQGAVGAVVGFKPRSFNGINMGPAYLVEVDGGAACWLPPCDLIPE